jgi:hypothetical protein
MTLITTGASANIITHIYTTPGTFVETVPTGYTTVTIEVWGGGGGGGLKFVSGPSTSGGGGGGSGAYCLSTYSVAGLGADTLNFTVGAGGNVLIGGNASSVSSGTMPITTMTATGGSPGTSATGLNAPGAGGPGGTPATGGTVANTVGTSGSAGQNTGSGGHGGSGGAGIPGINSGGNAGGSGSGVFPALAQVGGNGIVVFSYSP